MDAEKKIDVLLKEYDTLRAEMLHRLGSRFGIISIGLAFGAFWFSGVERPRWVAWAVYLSLAVLWVWIGRLMEQLSQGIQRVEREVNTRADGETLLRWESRGRSRVFATIFGRLSKVIGGWSSSGRK